MRRRYGCLASVTNAIALASLAAMLAPLTGCDKLLGNQAADAGGAESPNGAESSDDADPRPENRLLGAWLAGDPSVAAAGANGVGGDVETRMQQGIAEDSYRFEFLDRGRVVVRQGAAAPAEEGTWKVVASHGSRLDIRIDMTTLPARPEGPLQFSIAFDGRDRFTMRHAGPYADGDPLTLTFTRIRN
jgi:hypothetical protein